MKKLNIKHPNRPDRDTVNRCLLVGGIIFAVLLPLNAFVIPHFSLLDRQPFNALIAGAVALAAWWVAFRVWRR